MTSIAAQPVLSFRGVTKRFPGVTALRDVFVGRPARARPHAIVGENGAGKSTLVQCLSGVITDYQGELRSAAGRSVSSAPPTPSGWASASSTRS